MMQGEPGLCLSFLWSHGHMRAMITHNPLSHHPFPIPPPSSKKHNVQRPGTPVLLALSGMNSAPVPINAHCGSWST